MNDAGSAIQVISGTSEIHAVTFATALEAEVVSTPSGPSCLWVGVGPHMKEQVESYGGKKAAYWIGSDSLCAIQDPWYRKLVPRFDLHFCVHERIKEELSAWKVDSRVLYPCTRYEGGRQRIEHRAVGVYAPTPEEKTDIYRTKVCIDIARECPAVPFIFFGSEAPSWPTPENVKWWGREHPDNIGSIYERISCVLRLCVHDGFPVGGIEAKQRGLHVIEDYPYPGFLCPEVTVKTENGPVVGVSLDEIIRLIRADETHEGDSTGWPEWYQTKCSKAAFKKTVMEALCE